MRYTNNSANVCVRKNVISNYKTHEVLIMKKRQSGVLMHISSLPGAYGIGSLVKVLTTSLISWFAQNNVTGKSFH